MKRVWASPPFISGRRRRGATDAIACKKLLLADAAVVQCVGTSDKSASLSAPEVPIGRLALHIPVTYPSSESSCGVVDLGFSNAVPTNDLG